jgi:hypothetical protein
MEEAFKDRATRVNKKTMKNKKSISLNFDVFENSNFVYKENIKNFTSSIFRQDDKPFERKRKDYEKEIEI